MLVSKTGANHFFRDKKKDALVTYWHVLLHTTYLCTENEMY